MKQRKARDPFGARPLPAHFGEIDTSSPFNAERYFIVLRCSGMNPQIERKPDSELRLVMDIGRKQSRLQVKRAEAAHAWADKKDVGAKRRLSYMRKIARGLPVGEVLYLGVPK
jgi:hypothetical protein